MKKLIIPLVATVLVGVVMAFQAQTPETTVAEPPKVVLGELPGFSSEPIAPSEAELTVLPADTQIDKRLYTAANGHWYAVSVVIGGKSKSSIHRPELCLPSQGFMMASPRTRTVGATRWRLITLDGGIARPSLGFAYTFFNQEGYHTASHVGRIFRDILDRSLFNRIDRWVMVTVNSSRSDDAGLMEFLSLLKGVTE